MREQPNEEEQVRDERSQNQKRILNYSSKACMTSACDSIPTYVLYVTSVFFLRFALFFLMLEVALVRAAYVDVVAHLDLS